VTIEAWTAQYMVILPSHVEFDYVMKDGKTGTHLEEHRRVVYSRSSKAGTPPGALVAARCSASPRRPELHASGPTGQRPVFNAPASASAGPHHAEYGKIPRRKVNGAPAGSLQSSGSPGGTCGSRARLRRDVEIPPPLLPRRRTASTFDPRLREPHQPLLWKCPRTTKSTPAEEAQENSRPPLGERTLVAPVGALQLPLNPVATEG